MSESQSNTERSAVKWARHLPLPPPGTQRELFQLLGQYRPEHGLDELLQRIDLSGMTAAHITQVVLGRPLNGLDEALPSDSFDPRSVFHDLLLSDGFRRQILPLFLKAFPEKGRDVFIHVPKCAGTDLTNNLVTKRISLPKLLEFRNWLTDDDFLAVLSALAAAAPFHERVFVYGHMDLGTYVEQAGVRPIDRIFTIIRDPLDLMVSQANYAIGRLRQDPAGRDPDSAEVLRLLDLPRMPDNISDKDLKDLAVRALIHPKIAAPNRACTFLGQGHPGTYDTAIRNLIIHNVEITTTRHYERWLRERWGIARSERHNRSETLLTTTEVRRYYSDAIQDAMAEDQKLFDVVSWALEQTGGSAITGLEIGRLANGRLMRDLPQSLSCERAEAQKAGSAEANLLAVEEPQRVARYVDFPRVDVPGNKEIVVASSFEFGAGGAGQDYLMDGWSTPEKGFTWTNATESRLRLPPLPHDATCVIRLIGNPMVAKDRLLSQRIEIAVNGVPVGRCRISNVALIEFEMPQHLKRDGEPVELRLHLPDAAVPRSVNGANDDRLLAFALRNVSIVHMRPVSRVDADCEMLR